MFVVYLLYLYQAFHTLHGKLYFDSENEETIKRRCNPALTCFPSQLEWARLEENMTGRLVWPDDSFNYTMYNYQYNMWTVTYPIVHVVCKSVDDIQNAIIFAKKHELRVTIKSTGYEIWGRSSAHGSLNINLMEMKRIAVNLAATDRNAHGEMTVETGVKFGEIYEKVERYGRLVFGGNNNGIGLGGYIAGGGYGPLSPVFGLAVDNVLEIKVVLADGRLAMCLENKTVIENPDGTNEIRNNGRLFWALRGGGGGTYGVVVHYVLKLHPAPTSIGEASISISLHHDESDNHLVKLFFEAFAEWERNAPFYWGGSTFLSPGGLSATLKKYGPLDDNTESELKPFYDLQSFYLQPSMVTISLTNLTSFKAGGSWRFGFYTGGALLPPEKHTEGLWEFLVQEVMSGSNGQIFCYMNRLGGKTREYSEASSSVHPGYRRAQSYISCALLASSNEDGTSSWEMQEQKRAIVARFAEMLRKFADGANLHSSYIPSPDWKLDFWGKHYVDLLKVKIRYDPDSLFYCFHCVGSDRVDYVSSRATANVTNQFLSAVSFACYLYAALFHVK